MVRYSFAFVTKYVQNPHFVDSKSIIIPITKSPGEDLYIDKSIQDVVVQAIGELALNKASFEVLISEWKTTGETGRIPERQQMRQESRSPTPPLRRKKQKNKSPASRLRRSKRKSKSPYPGLRRYYE